MKQTAVEFLEDELYGFIHPDHGKDFLPILEKAKQMEKEQIENAYSNGRVDEQFKGTNLSFYRTKAEQYYNETFKS